MFKQGFDIAFKIVKILSILVAPVAVCIGIFALLCVSWFLVFKYYFKLEFKPSGIVPVKKRPLIKQLFYDFGTGYSNFDRILSLKLDVVKFDRSLLLMANKDENSQFILNYFSTAFKKLGYKVLYEGVETDEQETICVNSHADYLQGFKFSKPIPIEELKNFLSPIQE